MVRVPPCEKPGLIKGPWTPEEDQKLITYIQSHEHCSWRIVPKQAGLARCGKSCRLRWTNYLRPGIKRGNFSAQEESTIIQLHAALGNRWSTISTHLPGRTDNEIKNHWNTRLRKKLLKMGIDPTTHRPLLQHPLPFQPASINTSLLLSLLQGSPSPADVSASLANALLLGSDSFANKNGLLPAASGHVLQNSPMSTAPGAPPSSSVFPPPAALDPTLLAAAETRLVLDCLKFNNAENQSSTSDHHLNQLLTRLLLMKLLQGYNNLPPPPCNSAARHASKTSIPNFSQHAATDHLLRNQGYHEAGSMPVPAATNRQTAAAPEQTSAYYTSNSCSDLSDSSLPTTSTILNMFSSSYQQRLLQALPFLAESMIEPCTSAGAADHLSSSTTSPNQISQASFLNCPTELITPNCSLTSQQTPGWPAGRRDNEALPSGGRGAAGVVPPVMTTGAQLLAGAGIMQSNDSGPQTLMTWEERLMSEQKGGERDLASSSTVSSSTMSSASQCHATPNTPSGHDVHIQDYWSDLLNLINSTK